MGAESRIQETISACIACIKVDRGGHAEKRAAGQPKWFEMFLNNCRRSRKTVLDHLYVLTISKSYVKVKKEHPSTKNIGMSKAIVILDDGTHTDMKIHYKNLQTQNDRTLA